MILFAPGGEVRADDGTRQNGTSREHSAGPAEKEFPLYLVLLTVLIVFHIIIAKENFFHRRIHYRLIEVNDVLFFVSESSLLGFKDPSLRLLGWVR
ncbi:MAG: hypothetical protein JXE07_07945 [Candidatus Aminicenantes bacterium]|nr:hypothetical protein [Candidatus Aminicenantes bacterium]